MSHQDFYDKKYKDGGQEIAKASKRRTLELLPQTGQLSILDLGCGSGMNSRYMRSLGHTVFGIDLSENAIAQYQKQGFAGAVMNIEEGLDLEDQRFDVVFASEVIEHVVNVEKMLAESYRVLKPGGMLLLSTPNSAFWVYRVGALLGRTVSELQHPMHLRFFSKQSLATSLKEAGFVLDFAGGQNMYVLLPDPPLSALKPLFRGLRLTREFRFTSQTHYWHLSQRTQRLNEVFADTLIFKARKPT